MKLRFLNSSGLSLVEVLVAATIALIVIGGVGNIIIDSQKAQKSVQLGQNAAFFTNQLTSIMASSCPLAAANYVYTPAALTSPVDVDFGTVDFGTGSFQLIAGQNIPNLDLKINSFRMKNLSDDTPYTTAGVTYQSHKGALYISFTKTANILGVKTTKEAVVGLSVVTRTSDNVVTKCSLHGSTSSGLSATDYASVITEATQTSCESNGGTWVPTAPPDQRCQFPMDCKYYGSYASPPAGSTPSSGFVNPLTGGYSCPPGTTPYQQGVISAAVSCGKSCVNASFAPQYTCMKCGSGAIPPPPPAPPDPCGGTCAADQYCYPGYGCIGGAGGFDF
ncbi:MAG: PilW family protein [Pseudobdellovibrio sp.]